ncbi:MAG: hypothetical protein FGM37_00655 [Phycisphaerales bacterium]|nr:hypothetical protein [Phycisphaerales bacterium]
MPPVSGSVPAATDPPPASDCRLAQVGSEYRSSGRVGHGWLAVIASLAVGLASGYAGGALFGWAIQGLATGAPRPRLKTVMLMIALPLALTCIATAGCTWLGRVRAMWFVFLSGSLGGAAAVLSGLCAFVACAQDVTPRDWSAALSAACALMSDLGALRDGLAAAVPGDFARGATLAGGAAVSLVTGASTVVLHCQLTNDNLFDESTGDWYGSPIPVAALDSASRPTRPWHLAEWRPIAEAQEFERLPAWTVLREHPLPGQAGPSGMPRDGGHGLSLVSLAVATVTERRVFRFRKLRRVPHRQIKSKPEGRAFFVSPTALAGLKSIASSAGSIPS